MSNLSDTGTIGGNILNKGNIVVSFFEKNIIRAIHSFSASTPVVISILPLIISIILRDPKGALITGGSLMNLIINLILKFSIKQKPEFEEGKVKKICTFFEDYTITEGSNPPSKDYRMPSEHSQTVGYILGFFMARMVFTKRMDIMNMLLLLGLVVMVSWSRYNVKCHSMPQVAVGAVVGIGVGVFYYWISRECYETCGKKLEETETLCLGQDDNEYKCDTIKDGYVLKTNVDMDEDD